MSDYDVNSSLTGGDKEIQEFLLIEKQKAQVNAQVWITTNSKLEKSNYISYRIIDCLILDTRI